MNIGIITGALFPVKIGGIEKQSFELATWLSKFHNVCVYTKSHEKYKFVDYIFKIKTSRYVDLPLIRLFMNIIYSSYNIILDRKFLDLIVGFGTNDIGFKTTKDKK